MDTPDWLSSFTPTETQSSDKPADESQPAGNLPTEALPSWVQAMRPVESVIEETSNEGEDQELENLGPLAGFRSVLPTQAGPANLRTQKAHVTNLLVS